MHSKRVGFLNVVLAASCEERGRNGCFLSMSQSSASVYFYCSYLSYRILGVDEFCDNALGVLQNLGEEGVRVKSACKLAPSVNSVGNLVELGGLEHQHVDVAWEGTEAYHPLPLMVT